MIELIPTGHEPHGDTMRRYLSGDPSLAGRLGGVPDEATLVETASRFSSDAGAAASRARSLAAAHEGLDPDDATRRSLEALAEPNTLVVATGQQPGFLTGPMYSILKAASAVAAARRLQASTGRRVIPVYWVASDDHDLGEIEGCYCVREDGSLRRHRVDLGGRPWPTSFLDVPPGAEAAVAAFLEDLPRGEHTDHVRELVRAVPGEPWPRWFSRILLRLLPGTGVVLFDPARNTGLVEPWLLDAANDLDGLVARLAAGATALAQEGLPAPLPAAGPAGLFLFDGDRRRRVQAADLPTLEADVRRRPGALSADAALRPVLQSAVLPVVGVVGGPGELAYWAQLTELFDAFEVPRPVFLPRLSATLVEPRVARALKALGLRDEDLLNDRPPVAEAGPEDAAAPDLVRAREQSERALAALDDFGATLSSMGGPLSGRVADLRKVFRASLDKLLAAAERQEMERHGVTRRRVDLVASSGRPLGKPQDRVLNGLPFLVRGGPDLFSRIAEAVDPFDARHVLVRAEMER